MKRTLGQKLFSVFNMAIIVLMCFVCVYPLWHVLCASLSDPLLLEKHSGAFFFPAGFTLGGYQRVFENQNLISGFYNSIIYCVVTTTIGVFITSMAAYTLSHKEPKLNGIFMRLIMFTMWFGGGLMPFYILTKSLGLLNTRWSVILPALVSTWNLLVMRTSFAGMPDSLSESARIEGANDFTIYWRILMPLGGAVNAYIILLFAVGMWNSWFNASIFISNPALKPLQVILRDILIANDLNSMIQSGQVMANQGQEMLRTLVKYCTIIIAMLPILLVYPFLQKYFVSGVMIGSVKG